MDIQDFLGSEDHDCRHDVSWDHYY
jgi:hypothetical protein